MRLNLFPLSKLTALGCALLFPALPSSGFCFQPNPTAACEFLNSDAVFVGTVISERHVPPRGEKELDGWVYDLAVQELFRGPRKRTIEVFTENSSGRFRLNIGKQYLLFASGMNGRLVIANCGNSVLLSKASGAVRELRRLKIPKDAVIEGRISFSGIPDSGKHIPGIEVIIRGDGREFRATTDRKGWFHLHLPPGKYSAEAQPIPRWDVIPYDLSYDDPKNFEARKGHCSGLQFSAGPK